MKQKYIYIIPMLMMYLITSQKAIGQAKPKVWIYTDMSDKSIPGKNHMGTVNDPMIFQLWLATY